VSIRIFTDMPYGNAQALRDFAFAHRLEHIAIDNKIAQLGRGSMPNATLDSEGAMSAWISLMDDDVGVADSALLDWLKWHSALHQAEYEALNLGYAPELDVVHFEDENQFYDWMSVHASVHDVLLTATGVS
jgi:hypothetical protein